MSNPSIAMIQVALRDLGHDPGPVDGLWGSRTKAAAEAWIEARGRARSAVLAPETSGMIHQGAARHPVDEIVVHCSDTPASWMANRTLAEQVAEIRRWHVEERGWKDIGYHWVIGRDGRLLPGRPESVIGSHVLGHNPGKIGIVLIGGKGSNATDRFEQHFTPAQGVTLRQQVQAIGMRTRIVRVSGHNEYAARACPGFHVPTWLQGA